VNEHDDWPAPGPPGSSGRPTEPLGPPRPQPAREHQARRLSPLTPLARSGVLLAAVVFTSWDDFLRGDLGWLALGLLGVLIAGGIYGFVSWLRTKYWIEDDELRVDTGVLYHQSRRIRIDRLQGIDIVQPFVARLLGLAELKMDVAGGDHEGSLAFLPLAEAHQLREVLLARRDAVRRTPAGRRAGGPDQLHQPGTAGHAGTTPDGADPVDEVDRRREWAPPDHDIARLDLRMLLVSMLLAPETVVLVLVVVALGIAAVTVGAPVVAPTVPAIIGLALVQLRKLSAYYQFTVSQTRVGLQLRRGLFERSTQTIPLARVQGVVVSEPVMWRPLGWAKLDVSIAGYGSGGESDGRPSATTVMPVGPRDLILRLAQHLLRGEDQVAVDPDDVPLSPPPQQSRWLDPISRRFMAAGIGEHLVISREGWLTRRTHAVRHGRVQSVRLSQGPIQRRLGLADVHVDSPPGPVHVRARHRDAAEARALFEGERDRARDARRALAGS
jgi:putative membrane protein